jgi:hypothetical protein
MVRAHLPISKCNRLPRVEPRSVQLIRPLELLTWCCDERGYFLHLYEVDAPDYFRATCLHNARIIRPCEQTQWESPGATTPTTLRLNTTEVNSTQLDPRRCKSASHRLSPRDTAPRRPSAFCTACPRSNATTVVPGSTEPGHL